MGGQTVIIQCEKCGTTYRFDELLIDGDGVWVRCTRCQNIFFLENPAEEKIIFSEEVRDEEAFAGDIPERAYDKMTISFEDPSRVVGDTAAREDQYFMDHGEKALPDEPALEMPSFFEEAKPEEIPESDAETMPEETPEGGDTMAAEVADGETVQTSGKRTRILASVFVILAIAFAVDLILFRQFRQDLVDKILTILPLEESVVSGDASGEAVTPRGTEIYFIDTKEHAVNNWIIGDILVVEGIAINKGEFSASKVKVRGKILDAAGAVLMEEMSYGGTVLTEEELRNLTEDEVQSELSNPWGRDFDNRDISKDGRLPFMLVFINPPENSQEYVIDLASVDVGTKK